MIIKGKLYHHIIENMNDGFAFLKTVTNNKSDAVNLEFISINAVFKSLTGLDQKAILGRKWREVFDLPPFNRKWEELFINILKAEAVPHLDWYSELLKRWYAVKPVWLDKKYLGLFFFDISFQKKSQEALQKNEMRYRNLVEVSSDWIWEVNSDGVYTYSSPKVYELLGIIPQEVIGRTPFDFMPPDEAKRMKLIFKRIVENKLPFSMLENINLHKDGHPILLETSGVPIFDERGNLSGYRGIDRDITERKRIENDLRTMIRERNTLLREIHHRVRNNMQVISSLFNHHISYINDPGVVSMIRECQRRIKTMAHIHEKLYRSPSLSRINFTEFIEELIIRHIHSYKDEADQVNYFTEIEQIELDIDTAIPLGLIASELVSNAMKHAFPRGKSGQIQLHMSRDKDQIIKLVVKDNGIGIPEDVDIRKTETLGMQLVMLLVEQIEGKIELGRKNGTELSVCFRERSKTSRLASDI